MQFAIPPRFTKQDVQYLKELVETGKFRPVVDRCYTMQQVVEAARYVETEQKASPDEALDSARQDRASLSVGAICRHDARQEPGALAAHAGICSVCGVDLALLP